jgi:Holliday junction DNA helicase RuvA
VIATLRGEVSQIEETGVVVEVGGVGMRVFLPRPLRERLRIGEGALLHTQLVVREDSLALYGFETQADRELFSLLLGVTGVGPRTALALLSALPNATIQQAVGSGQADVLSCRGCWR